MVEEPQIFTKQETCTECGEPLNQQENWGCAHAWIPVYGFVQMVVEIHQHLHIRCAHGHLKWLALSRLGRFRSDLN